MEPEYAPSHLPDSRHPGAVYFEASVRPSSYQLADTTHGDSSETNPCWAGDSQDQPDTPGTFLDRINWYQQVVTEEPPHTATDSHQPKATQWCWPYPDENHQHNLECWCILGQRCTNGHHGHYTLQRQQTPSDTQQEENPTDRLNFDDIALMTWLTDYTVADVSDLKTMAKPWYCLHEDLSQGHDTTTLKAMYNLFCFAVIPPPPPGKGIDEFHLIPADTS